MESSLYLLSSSIYEEAVFRIRSLDILVGLKWRLDITTLRTSASLDVMLAANVVRERGKHLVVSALYCLTVIAIMDILVKAALDSCPLLSMYNSLIIS